MATPPTGAGRAAVASCRCCLLAVRATAASASPSRQRGCPSAAVTCIGRCGRADRGGLTYRSQLWVSRGVASAGVARSASGGEQQRPSGSPMTSEHLAGAGGAAGGGPHASQAADVRFPSLQELHDALRGIKDDPLEQYGGQIVTHRGSNAASLMIIGEAPGAEEDRLGKPFVGRSGELLDKILGAVQMDSNKDAYITNIVKRRPPNNRDPTEEEVAYYRPWLDEEMRLLQPAVVMLVGRIAMRALLGEVRGITKVRGEWYTRNETLMMPMLHPSYLLRNPDRRPGSPRYQTWQDIQEVRRQLDGRELGNMI